MEHIEIHLRHLYPSSSICDRCCQINYHELPQYELIKTNSYSKQPIISRRVVSNVSECEKFAASKKALAFNLASTRNREGRHENLCQALQCPEDYNMTTLVPKANYEYYSMYPVFVPSENTTVECIPRVGIFLFSSENLNYTQARTFCRGKNASLAHIISEERTEGLAKFVSPTTPRFVGLSNNDGERIWKNVFGIRYFLFIFIYYVRATFLHGEACKKFSRNVYIYIYIYDLKIFKNSKIYFSTDEPLSCFEYRAWGEGQPSHSRGCAVLVNSPDKDTSPSWKVVPCYISLPFICEVTPLTTRQRSSRRRHGYPKFSRAISEYRKIHV
ncbi:hypothetical protein EAI_13335 [Harpegnathos saltator]|uniref:C-type lectin domain-containing protein n=1 Tax=Harpegnathos saltator TaxID=610380 RepID=E2C0R9_HARSA|nr:hypothetical protein EAI_13335 [Harpegnathos saltator]